MCNYKWSLERSLVSQLAKPDIRKQVKEFFFAYFKDLRKALKSLSLNIESQNEAIQNACSKSATHSATHES